MADTSLGFGAGLYTVPLGPTKKLAKAVPQRLFNVRVPANDQEALADRAKVLQSFGHYLTKQDLHGCFKPKISTDIGWVSIGYLLKFKLSIQL